ncbi:uncharacterized protein LOC143805181 isoform X3 [Ranitomeya variabilis]|uniref:uncharacterized protein LOC143805181 isoform X3 n=1 Tax=Ranitomeya variabilis TaxID=490064 RepID=UPI004057A405
MLLGCPLQKPFTLNLAGPMISTVAESGDKAERSLYKNLPEHRHRVQEKKTHVKKQRAAESEAVISSPLCEWHWRRCWVHVAENAGPITPPPSTCRPAKPLCPGTATVFLSDPFSWCEPTAGSECESVSGCAHVTSTLPDRTVCE